MTSALAPTPITPHAVPDLSAIERVIIAGDLGKLTAEERWDYYRGVCRSVGLNAFTQPFLYVTLSGKLTLYATKGAAEQLRRIYGVSIARPEVSFDQGLCLVSVVATDATGRTDSDLGIVPIEGLKGEARSNAILKALTKSKRRVTLSMCGLGMLDETEIATIPGAVTHDVATMHGEVEPSADELERAAEIVVQALTEPQAPPPVDRAALEAHYRELAKDAVLRNHPKKERIESVSLATLSDEVVAASIRALDEWLTVQKAKEDDPNGDADIEAF